MPVKKRGGHWHYDFTIRGVRYRGAIPEARTKDEARYAETVERGRVFEGNYGKQLLGQRSFAEFVESDYLPWAKVNKRTWANDEYICRQILGPLFGRRSLRECSPMMIEKLKRELLARPTKRGTARAPASVNMVLCVGSRIFSLAVDTDQAASNPFRKVKKLALNNYGYRYLTWNEEPALMAELRPELADAVIVAIGAGPRRSEQLRLRAGDCDFARNVITFQQTKSHKRPREVPMSDAVRAVLERRCRGKRRDQFLFVNRATGKPFLDFKKGFLRACANAGIEDLTWRDLRATFGTRLGEAAYNAFEIADLMGHADIRTTQRYVRVDPRKHEAVQATMRQKVVA